ncbi:MAG: two-component system sensor histidine kinase NtrB [Paracoccaceae bacterium]
MTRGGDLWAALPIPALLLGAGDAIAESNPAAEAFLNKSERALRGRNVWSLLAMDADIVAPFERARRDGTPLFVNQVRVGTDARAPVDCDMQVAPMPGGADVLLLITPRHDKMQVVRPGARSAIGMADMLAHEIKNPLAGITGAAQLLAMELPAEQRELTDLIVEETRRVVAILGQVEEFGNIRPPDRRAVNVHDVLDRARRSAEVGVARHMRLEEAYDPSLPPALVDPDQLGQVIANLVRNAAEAQPAGGTVRLRTFYDPSLRMRGDDGAPRRLPLQIEVSDDGPGLPPEIEAEVFEPFVSGRENGTGLGLALVHRLMLDNAGWVTVDSRPGRTAFRLSLAVARDGRLDEPRGDA